MSSIVHRLRPLVRPQWERPPGSSQLAALLARYALQPGAWLADNRVRPLVDGQAFPAMLAAIAAARQEILLEVYIWEHDATGAQFCAALLERVRAGVAVFVVVDEVGAPGFLRHDAPVLRAAGVQVAGFHPLAPWRRRWGWSTRDHRKLLVVDGHVGFVGGFNIGDAYVPVERGGGGWHDLEVQLHGPCVRELQKAFAQSWREATHASAPAAPGLVQRRRHGTGRAAVQVLPVASRRERRRIRRQYLLAVRRARRNIFIAMAYFIPDAGWRSALANAARRGVDVRVMFPGLSDVPAVQHASRATYTWLLRRGIQIYEWQPSMLHGKSIMVDGRWYAVGSYNLDRRSLVYNWELAVAVIDPNTAAVLEQRFRQDLTRSRAVTLEQWEQRGWWSRAMEWFWYLFRRKL